MVPSGSWAWMEANCAQFGLRTFRHVNNEPWHLQPVEIPARRAGRVPPWDLLPWPLPIESGPPTEEEVGDQPIPVSPPAPPPTPSPTIERIEIPMHKTTLHPDLRSQLSGSNDVRLVQVLALGLHAVSGHPTFDVGAVDADYGPRTQAAARLMQQLNGLDVDGIVGPRSWAAFLNADGA